MTTAEACPQPSRKLERAKQRLTAIHFTAPRSVHISSVPFWNWAKVLPSNNLLSPISGTNPYNLAHISGTATSKPMQTGE